MYPFELKGCISQNSLPILRNPFDKQRFADRARYLIKYQGYGKGQYNNFNNQMWDERNQWETEQRMATGIIILTTRCGMKASLWPLRLSPLLRIIILTTRCGMKGKKNRSKDCIKNAVNTKKIYLNMGRLTTCPFFVNISLPGNFS